jgi:hypothetical protein
MFHDLMQIGQDIAGIILGLWGLCEILGGLWNKDREQLILGICIATWSSVLVPK